jgi:hypothetical protein
LERPNSLLLDHTKHCGTNVAVQKIARPWKFFVDENLATNWWYFNKITFYWLKITLIAMKIGYAMDSI